MSASLKSKIYIVGSCSVVLVIISLLNWYATPTMSDDVIYLFKWQWEWHVPFERITSLRDVVQSQLIHYQIVNGRSITHSLAQIALNLIPPAVAKLINIGMFGLLLWLIIVYTAQKKGFRLVNGVLAFGLIFLVMKGFDTAFLWLLGSYTYVWALVFTMCFLCLLRKLGDRRISWKLLPLIPISFILGWSHEAIALPITLSCLLYLVINHKGLLFRANTYCILAYMLGMLMILTSPSLWMRADIEGITPMQRLLSGCINMALNVRISWILLLTLIINYKRFIDILERYGYLLFAWIMALGIVFLCGTTLERVAICADFLSLLIVLQIWQSERLLKHQYTIINSLLVAAIIVSVPAIAYSKQNYDNYLYHRSQLQHQSLIKVRQISGDVSWFEKQVIERYVNPTIEFGFFSCYMAFDSQDINSMAVAQLYHQDTVTMLPEDVINKIERDSTAYMHWEADVHGQLYIQSLQDDKEFHQVTFLLGDEVPLRFYQRILSYQGNEYVLDDFNHEVVSICGRRYLVMTIPPSNIKRRIKDIRIE